MSTLYQITEEMRAFESMVDAADGEIDAVDAERIEAWWATITADLHAKSDDVVAYVRELEARAAARKREADFFATSASRDEAKAKRLKSMLARAIQLSGLPSVGTRFSARVVGNGGLQPLEIMVPVHALPPRLQRVAEVVSADTEAIRAGIAAGTVPPEIAALKPRGIRLAVR